MPTFASTIAPKFEVKSRASLAAAPTKMPVSNLNFFYGRIQALKESTVDVPERMVMAFIGRSGCGKTTFLRTLNRMNDVITGTRVERCVTIDCADSYSACADAVELP